MDVTNLTSLVTALRAETAYAAITPESLGGLLQKIVDAIGKTSSDDDIFDRESAYDTAATESETQVEFLWIGYDGENRTHVLYQSGLIP